MWDRGGGLRGGTCVLSQRAYAFPEMIVFWNHERLNKFQLSPPLPKQNGLMHARKKKEKKKKKRTCQDRCSDARDWDWEMLFVYLLVYCIYVCRSLPPGKSLPSGRAGWLATMYDTIPKKKKLKIFPVVGCRATILKREKKKRKKFFFLWSGSPNHGPTFVDWSKKKKFFVIGPDPSFSFLLFFSLFKLLPHTHLYHLKKETREENSRIKIFLTAKKKKGRWEST